MPSALPSTGLRQRRQFGHIRQLSQVIFLSSVLVSAFMVNYFANLTNAANAATSASTIAANSSTNSSGASSTPGTSIPGTSKESNTSTGSRKSATTGSTATKSSSNRTSSANPRSSLVAGSSPADGSSGGTPRRARVGRCDVGFCVERGIVLGRLPIANRVEWHSFGHFDVGRLTRSHVAESDGPPSSGPSPVTTTTPGTTAPSGKQKLSH